MIETTFFAILYTSSYRYVDYHGRCPWYVLESDQLAIPVVLYLTDTPPFGLASHTVLLTMDRVIGYLYWVT